MELMDAIRNRRAVREYTSEPVAPDTIRALIEAATLAPSAVNAQPWLFTVIRDGKVLDRISAAAKAHMLTLIGEGSGLHGMREHLTNPEFHIFYHAPVLILISASGSDGWAVEDATLAAENLMLAACDKGLGTCWIGFAQRWLETEDGRRTAGFSAEFRPVAPIIVGHPKGASPAVPRNAPTIHWIG